MIKLKKAKRIASVALLSLLIGMFVLSSSVLVFADPTDINEIGGTTTTETTVTEQQSNISNSQTTTPSNATNSGTSTTTTTNNGGNQVTQNASKNESTAKAVGDLFGAAGVDEESAAKAKKWIEPVAKILNTVIAVILGLFASMLILVSVLDMVYLGIPITRQWLCPGGADMSAGAAAGGMAGGMGGMGMGGMGMGGMGGMGGAAQAQPTLGASIGRWISDDALAAVNESQNGMAAGAMAGGMGMGMQQGMPPAHGKNVMFAYLKKRAFSLVMLGVCLVLFSCTVFTDLGITVGTKIIGLLTGIGM